MTYAAPASLLLLFGLSSASLANDGRSSEETSDDESDSSGSADDSSTAARAKVKFNIGAELYLGANLSAGYQVNRDTAIEVFAESPPLSVFTPCGPGETTIDGGYVGGARFRRYLGNSVNFTVSPYYRKAKTQCRWRGSSSAHRTDGPDPAVGTTRTIDDQNSLGLSTSIGNRWQWRHFYLGAEWLGLGLDESFKFLNHAETRDESKAKVIFLRFVLGASF